MALALVAGCALGFFFCVWVLGDRRLGQPGRSAGELDHLLMMFERERARAVELGPAGEAICGHIDTVIGSLTRVRVAIAEGREINVDLELAAIIAADEQIVRGAERA